MYNRIENAQLKDKRVFLRVDFEKIFSSDGNIYKEILAAVKPTVDFCQSRGSQIIIGSHTGTPETAGRYKYNTIVPLLEQILGKKVHLLSITGDSLKSSILEIPPGEIVLLENLLHHPSEAKNLDTFAKHLAEFSDIYINDAFGSSIHSYCSLIKLPALLPSFMGISFQNEMDILQGMLSGKNHPLVIILGGTGIEKKIKLLQKLFQTYNHIIDEILVGGAISFTFLKSRAHGVGSSTIEQNFEVNAFQIIEKAELNEKEIQLPADHVSVEQISNDAKTKIQSELTAPWRGIDIGPKTLGKYEKILKKAKFVIWYGPMGMIEVESFSKGTYGLAKIIAKSKARSVVIGEDTAFSVIKSGYADAFSLVNPNGSQAWIEIIKGNELPALAALKAVVE